MTRWAHKLGYNPLMFTKFLLLIFLLLTQSGFANDKSIEYIGDGLAVIIPASAYGTTLYMNDHDGQTAFYKSVVLSSATTFGLKFTVKRERPDGSNDRSFPSAHAMYSFQGATFIHRRYGLKYSLAAYLGAAFVGYSRIEADKHYLGDVLAGAAIGSLSSWFFTDRYKDVALQPLAAYGSYGIMIAYRW